MGMYPQTNESGEYYYGMVVSLMTIIVLRKYWEWSSTQDQLSDLEKIVDYSKEFLENKLD